MLQTGISPAEANLNWWTMVHKHLFSAGPALASRPSCFADMV